ncbi:glycoside hydrolase family 105 protein [Paenibacillus sp. LMG 31461]|uniref:Glycoside hydrolase family 105 protein n=1 Tax=Paenibacillus plantarum TaxID=2654975 RepID=A0ABX1X8X0_9BACL|nr:glycoside hydrolase family 88 protein [Paenibacillus plantarum]NOU64826.1 glycoside hydrolase family 105 protein [Paenibacillus plantarum]
MKQMMALKDVASRVIHQMKTLGNETQIAEECPISIIDMGTWEWAQGVGLYGLLRYYQETSEGNGLAFLIEWFDRNIADGLPEKNVNTMCPMLTLTYVYELTGNPAYLALSQEWAEWIMTDMPRTEENGLQHIVSGQANEQQLWDDTLFMTVLFLARMGTLLGRQDYLDESVRQFLVHIKYLTDRKTGLWYHGWAFEGRHHFANALWARGNCWYTAGIVDYLDIIQDLNGGVKMFLLDALLSQVEALEKLQHENGMWHTLLDDPNSYIETSATAGFAYGILKAVRLGYLPPRFRTMGESALRAVLARTKENGIVTEVSYGTGMGLTLDAYREIPLCPMTYGQALTLMLITEGIKLESSQS